jgi:hypothetical protein
VKGDLLVQGNNASGEAGEALQAAHEERNKLDRLDRRNLRAATGTGLQAGQTQSLSALFSRLSASAVGPTRDGRAAPAPPPGTTTATATTTTTARTTATATSNQDDNQVHTMASTSVPA